MAKGFLALQWKIIHSTYRSLTVVNDLPAVLDDFFDVGNRCAHKGAILPCGSPMR
jgi:hypothetical protein